MVRLALLFQMREGAAAAAAGQCVRRAETEVIARTETTGQSASAVEARGMNP